jgi:hemoglobin
MRTTIFAALGGPDRLAAAVDRLYDRLVADPVVAPYFDRVALPRLKAHLRTFLAAALGGPHLYRGRDMRVAHAQLGVTAEAWNRTVDHLAGVLADLGVDSALAGDVLALLAPLRDQIVSAPARGLPLTA